VKICGLSRLPNLVRSLNEKVVHPQLTGNIKCSLLLVTNATQVTGDKQILADPKFFFASAAVMARVLGNCKLKSENVK
jgi:hypothetical protein